MVVRAPSVRCIPISTVASVHAHIRCAWYFCWLCCALSPWNLRRKSDKQEKEEAENNYKSGGKNMCIRNVLAIMFQMNCSQCIGMCFRSCTVQQSFSVILLDNLLLVRAQVSQFDKMIMTMGDDCGMSPYYVGLYAPAQYQLRCGGGM